MQHGFIQFLENSRFQSKIRNFFFRTDSENFYTWNQKIVILDVESHFICYLFFVYRWNFIIYESHILI